MNNSEEKRDVKIMWAKTGNGSTTTRVTLPVPWVRQLGLTEDNRVATLELKDNQIIITKK